MGLKTTFNAASPQIIPGWDPSGKDNKVVNYEKGDPGWMNLVKATAESVNTVYAQLNMKVGQQASATAAQAAGISSTIPPVNSNVLGSGTVHPLEMAGAYATIAAQGVQHPTFIVREVLDSTGKSVFKGGSPGKQTFAADVMADTTYAMQQVVQDRSGTGHQWISPLNIPVAGKTGTSSNTTSAWFDGFTTSITSVVALSQVGEDGKSQETITAPPGSGVKEITGGSWPAALWADYMKPVLAMPQWTPKSDFPQPAWVGAKPTATATAAPTETATPTSEPTTQAPTTVQVPANLIRSTKDDASGALLNTGLSPVIVTAPSDTVPAGRVISASPASGATVPAGSVVTLTVSTGPAATATPTPPPPTSSPAPTAPPTAAAAGGAKAPPAG